mmetsp:Transcript_24831/g.36435  ORF Transcript_24831/g.36435 Transcript_24831/m.36435 type:complete len:309 (-) Transcript_24831:677-1603(-)
MSRQLESFLPAFGAIRVVRAEIASITIKARSAIVIQNLYAFERPRLRCCGLPSKKAHCLTDCTTDFNDVAGTSSSSSPSYTADLAFRCCGCCCFCCCWLFLLGTSFCFLVASGATLTHLSLSLSVLPPTSAPLTPTAATPPPPCTCVVFGILATAAAPLLFSWATAGSCSGTRFSSIPWLFCIETAGRSCAASGTLESSSSERVKLRRGDVFLDGCSWSTIVSTCSGAELCAMSSLTLRSFSFLIFFLASLLALSAASFSAAKMSASAAVLSICAFSVCTVSPTAEEVDGWTVAFADAASGAMALTDN